MMKRMIKVVLLLFMALAAWALTPMWAQAAPAVPSDSWAYVEAMNPGWSLGNSLEYQAKRYGYVASGQYGNDFDIIETMLRNPVTTKELIQAVADRGFKTIRIPVSFYNHLTESTDAAPGRTVDPVWLAHVKRVVDWALEAGLYVVINDHHDTGMWMNMSWIHAQADDLDTQIDNLMNIWSQYAAYFKDYDHRLVFQATGEIVNKSRSFSVGSWQDFRAVHEINQAFIDTVRGTGGNNGDRYLILPTYASNSGPMFVDESFYKPYVDTPEGRLIFSVHNYSNEPEELAWYFAQLYKRAIENDMPFIMGECGSQVRDSDAVRQATYRALGSLSGKYKSAVFVWDDGRAEFGLIDRAETIRSGEIAYVTDWSYESNGVVYSGVTDGEGAVRALFEGIASAPVLTESERRSLMDNTLKTVDFQYLTPETHRDETAYGAYFVQGRYDDTHVDAPHPTPVFMPIVKYFASLYPYVTAQPFEALLPENVIVVIREMDALGNYIGTKWVTISGRRYTPSPNAAYAAVSFRRNTDGGAVDESMTKEAFDAMVAAGTLQLYPVGGTPVLPPAPPEGSITLIGTGQNKSYAAYRILELPSAEGDYFVPAAWEEFYRGPGAKYLTAATAVSHPTLLVDGTLYRLALTQSNVADFVADAGRYVRERGLPATVSGIGNDTGRLEWTGLELGAYLLIHQDALSNLCTLTEEEPAAQVHLKRLEEVIEKRALDGPGVDVGTYVRFQIVGKVPDTKGFTDYLWQVRDVMDAGLSYSAGTAQMTVTVDGVAFTGFVLEDIRLAHNGEEKRGFCLTVPVMSLQDHVGAEIVITYRVQVNEEAVCVLTENHAMLRYGPREEITETPWVDAAVWSNRISLDKHDGAAAHRKLAGAKFVLVKNEAGMERFYKSEGAGVVRWVDSRNEATALTTDDNGYTCFSGMADGIYLLREIEAPDGYNRLEADVSVLVQGAVSAVWPAQGVGVNAVLPVANRSGAELPAAGGVGAAGFVRWGSLLSGAGALALLADWHRRRREN